METSQSHSANKSSPSPLSVVFGVFFVSLTFVAYIQANLDPSVSWTYSCLILIAAIFISVFIFFFTPKRTHETNKSTIAHREDLFSQPVNRPRSPSHVQKELLESNFHELQELLSEKEIYIKKLKEDFDEKNHQLQQAEALTRELTQKNADLGKSCASLERNLQQQAKEAKETLSKKSALLDEYKMTIHEQRGIIEKKQAELNLLQTKVKDLSYEVKALLQLDELPQNASWEKKSHLNTIIPETEFDHYDINNLYESLGDSEQQVSHFDAFNLIDKYLYQIKNLRTGSYLNKPAFSGQGDEKFSLLDLRKLQDVLQGEDQFVLFLFSLKNRKVLFTNNKVKTYLSLSPEAFSSSFFNLVQKGNRDFEQAITRIPETGKESLKMILKSQNQEDMLFNCYLEKVNEGCFDSLVLGMLIPC